MTARLEKLPPRFAHLRMPLLRARRRMWMLRLRRRRAKLRRIQSERTSWRPRTQYSPAEKTRDLRKWSRSVAQATRAMQAYGAAIVWRKKPMRLRALEVARSLLGIREQGGNNRGAEVMAIIRANGGAGPEAWCGDFAAFCYRRAGSRAVQRLWAAVRFIGRLAGTRTLRSIRAGLAGDLVCFRFPGGGDHVALLVGYCDADGSPVAPHDATHVHTIDGNSSGDDVSDSAAGGDGVVERIRPIGMVERVVRVTR